VIDWRILLPICILMGVVVNSGLRGIGWLAHFLMPGLMLGVVLFVIIWVCCKVFNRG